MCTLLNVHICRYFRRTKNKNKEKKKETKYFNYLVFCFIFIRKNHTNMINRYIFIKNTKIILIKF